MIDKEMLEIFVCPQDQSPLRLADEELVAKINRAIAAGEIKNQGGQPLTDRLDGGLVRQDGATLYPIIDDIPVLLIDEAIPLDQIA